MDFCQEKLPSPKSDPWEGEIWIGTALAKKYRLVLSIIMMIDSSQPFLM